MTTKDFYQHIYVKAVIQPTIARERQLAYIYQTVRPAVGDGTPGAIFHAAEPEHLELKEDYERYATECGKLEKAIHDANYTPGMPPGFFVTIGMENTTITIDGELRYKVYHIRHNFNTKERTIEWCFFLTREGARNHSYPGHPIKENAAEPMMGLPVLPVEEDTGADFEFWFLGQAIRKAGHEMEELKDRIRAERKAREEAQEMAEEIPTTTLMECPQCGWEPPEYNGNGYNHPAELARNDGTEILYPIFSEVREIDTDVGNYKEWEETHRCLECDCIFIVEVST